jgi:hypothetical protein
MTQVTLQAVLGAIRSTSGLTVSKRYTSGNRAPGVYAQLDWKKDIEIGYFTAGYSTQMEKAPGAIASVKETLAAKGIAFSEVQAGKLTRLVIERVAA